MVHLVSCLIGMQLSCSVLAVGVFVVIRNKSDIEERSVASFLSDVYTNRHDVTIFIVIFNIIS